MKLNNIQLADIPLPSTEKIERQVIADAIGNPDMLGEASLLIDEDSFTSDDRKTIWGAIMRLYSTGAAIDMVSILQTVGGVYLEEIVNRGIQFGSGLDFMSHARLLSVAATKRRAYFAAIDVLQKSVQPQVSEDDIIGAAEGLSREVQGKQSIANESPLDTVLDNLEKETKEDQEEAMKGGSVKVKTSIPALDYLLYGGFGRGQLIILAARPSIGKTALMLQFAKHAAEAKVPATIFSLEMTKSELGKRLMFSTGYISQKDIVGKHVDWEGFEAAKKDIDALPLYINDEARTMATISARLTSAVRNGQCGIAFIDYLGLMKFDISGKVNFSQQIGFVTADLKALAKRLKIPIVLLVQLNREFAKEGETTPQLHHLKDSGNIEQDADVVLMLANGKEGLDLWVRKNRNYIKDKKITLITGKSYTSFREVRPDWADSEGYDLPRPTIAELEDANVKGLHDLWYNNENQDDDINF